MDIEGFNEFELNLEKKFPNKKLLSAIGKVINIYIDKRPRKKRESAYKEIDLEPLREEFFETVGEGIHVYRDFKPKNDELDNSLTHSHYIKNLIRGIGGLRFPLAAYYWFHTKYISSNYAALIDDELFGDGVSYEQYFKKSIIGKKYSKEESNQLSRIFRNKHISKEVGTSNIKIENLVADDEKQDALTNKERQLIIQAITDYIEGGLVNIDLEVPQFPAERLTFLSDVYSQDKNIYLVRDDIRYKFNVSLLNVSLFFESYGFRLQKTRIERNSRKKDSPFIITYWPMKEERDSWKINICGKYARIPLKGTLIDSSREEIFYADLEEDKEKHSLSMKHLMEPADIGVEGISEYCGHENNPEKKLIINQLIIDRVIKECGEQVQKVSFERDDFVMERDNPNAALLKKRIGKTVNKISEIHISQNDNFIHLFNLAKLSTDTFKSQTIKRVDLSNLDLEIFDFTNTTFLDCKKNNRTKFPKSFQKLRFIQSNTLTFAQAVITGNQDVILKRIREGVDVNQKIEPENDLDRTAMDFACHYGYEFVVDALIEAGADVTLSYIRSEDAPIITAVTMGHANIVKSLIEAGASVNHLGLAKSTLLMLASEKNYLSVVETLIKFGAEVDLCDHHGNSALSLSCREGHLEIVKALENAGADIDLIGKSDGNPINVGNLPIEEACRKGYKDVVRFLIDAGANVNLKNSGHSALSHAAGMGYGEIVKMLINAGVDIKNDLALIINSQYDFAKTAKILIDVGLDVNFSTQNNETPLYFASRVGNTTIVRMLIEGGADVNVKTRDKNLTALRMAREHGFSEIVDMLVEAGATD